MSDNSNDQENPKKNLNQYSVDQSIVSNTKIFAEDKVKRSVKENQFENYVMIQNLKDSINLNQVDKLSDNPADQEESKNKSLRCLECESIPLLSLDPVSHTININCNNGHNSSMLINEYLKQGYNNNFINKECKKCNTKIEPNIEKKFYYCNECNEFLCKNCSKSHADTLKKENKTHHFINLNKFDVCCILHNETYDYFCIDCNKNVCQYCYHKSHKNHNVIDLDNINLRRKEIKKIKECFRKEKDNISHMKEFISQLLANIKEDIDKILEYKLNEMEFKKNVIRIYENKLDNYNTIKNIRNLMFDTELFKVDDKTTNHEKLIYFYNYINKDISKLIGFKKAEKKDKFYDMCSEKSKDSQEISDMKFIQVNKIKNERNNRISQDIEDTLNSVEIR